MTLKSSARSLRISLAASPLIALIACTPPAEKPQSGIQKTAGYYLAGSDCDSLVPDQCGFPFPSNVYLVEDSKGRHVQFGPTTMPVAAGEYTNPTPWTKSDGFSSGQAPITYLPGATVKGLATPASPATIGESLSATSPTILIEAETGARIAHWAEIDQSIRETDANNTDHTFMIRPVYRLKDSTRYIVAIRHVKNVSDQDIEPSPAFKALRDGTKSDDKSVEARRGLYADIFAKLEKAGISKSDLQIAWDYTTASKENNTRDMIALRDDALRVVGADGPEYTIPSGPINVAPVGGDETDIIEGITMNPNSDIAMRIEGTMHVPLYLTRPNPRQSPEESDCFLVRDPETGLPKQSGWADYPFEVQIPKSVVNAGTNAALNGGKVAPIVQNGHGLLGSRHEGHNGYMSRMANSKGYISLAVPLTGFDHWAVFTATTAVGGDIGAFLNMVDPQHQGLVDELLAMRMMNRMAKDPRFFFNDDGTSGFYEADGKTPLATPGGHSVFDTTRRYYRGDSQGGIMGTTYMAISTEVTRGLLGEPGMPYNLLLNRSLDFDGYFALLKATYIHPSGRDLQLILGLMQMLWDRTEPNGYAPYINKDMLPNTPKHEVLLNVAIGDFQVSPLGAHILARAVGAKNLKPVNREIFGIESADGPFEGSGITEFEFHLDKQPGMSLPLVNIANNGPNNCDPHDAVREESPVFNQTDLFFRTGQIRNFCTGHPLSKKDGDYCSFDESLGPTPEELIEPPAVPHACTPG